MAKAKGKTETPPKTDPVAKFDMIDAEDEQQILDEIRGIPVDKFVYQNKRNIWELSYAGTKWAVRKMAQHGEAIRVIGHPQIILCPMDPEYIVATVLAERVLVETDGTKERRLDSTVGSSRNWKKQARKEGGPIPDPHFLKKAVSIATRNVQQMLMPFETKKKLIDELVAMKGGQNVGGQNSGGRGATGGARSGAAPSSPAGTPPPPGKQGSSGKPAKEPENPDAADPKDRQKLHILMSRFIRDANEKKKAFVDLTGKQKTSELHKDAFAKLLFAFQRIGEGKVNELKQIEGKYAIVEKPTGNILFPEGFTKAASPDESPAPEPDGAPPPSEDEMF